MSETEWHVDRIDWAAWKPTEYANLCFVMRDGQILLIRKKRGLGAGKINGPGGRLEKGETALDSAIRETQEEVGVKPTGLEQIGELFFQFLDECGFVGGGHWGRLCHRRLESRQHSAEQLRAAGLTLTALARTGSRGQECPRHTGYSVCR